jgi:YHS domain-containing protein
MNTSSINSNQNSPEIVETACGAMVQVSPYTPSINYQGETVYFCGRDCHDLYTEDPMNSCLASRLLSVSNHRP